MRPHGQPFKVDAHPSEAILGETDHVLYASEGVPEHRVGAVNRSPELVEKASLVAPSVEVRTHEEGGSR